MIIVVDIAIPGNTVIAVRSKMYKVIYISSSKWSEGGIVKLQITAERTLENVLKKKVVAVVFLF